MYSEKNYSLAGVIYAYEPVKFYYDRPYKLPMRRITDNDFIVSSSATPIILPIRKSEGATIKDAEKTTQSGDIHTVTVDFDVFDSSEAAYNAIQKLKTAKVLICHHLGGRRSLINSTYEGWNCVINSEDGMHVTLTIQNPNGVQRIE